MKDAVVPPADLRIPLFAGLFSAGLRYDYVVGMIVGILLSVVLRNPPMGSDLSSRPHSGATLFHPRPVTLLQCRDKLCNSFQRNLNVLDGICVRESKIPFAKIAKGRAGEARNVSFV